MKNNNLRLKNENSLRVNAVARSIGEKIKDLYPSAKRGLDIGCQRGQITEIVSSDTNIIFYGIEPDYNEVLRSSKKVTVIRGQAENLPFPDSTFDIVTIISVIEHIPPKHLEGSFSEIFLVLKQGGYCIGQISNMNFPIEVHSHLPFQQYLPDKAKDKYLNMFSKEKNLKTDWYRTTIKKVSAIAYN